jgi:hypothetical protein
MCYPIPFGGWELAQVEKRLSPRDSIALRERLKGSTKVDALRVAGYSESTALTQSTRIFNRIEETLQDVMERRGLGADAFCTQLLALLDSTLADSEGFPDNRVRLGAAKLWSDLRGWEPPKETRISGDVNVTVNVRRAEQSRVFEKLGGLT